MYISFGKRLVAWIIDALVINAILNLFLTGLLNYRSLYVDFILSQNNWEVPDDFWGFLKYGMYSKIGIILSLLISWLYFTTMESSKLKATLGKLAVGSVVVDEMDERISLSKANARFWGKLLSSLIVYIGYLMVLFTEHRQGLHDKIVGTYVVDKEQLASYLAASAERMDGITKIGAKEEQIHV